MNEDWIVPLTVETTDVGRSLQIMEVAVGSEHPVADAAGTKPFARLELRWLTRGPVLFYAAEVGFFEHFG